MTKSKYIHYIMGLGHNTNKYTKNKPKVYRAESFNSWHRDDHLFNEACASRPGGDTISPHHEETISLRRGESPLQQGLGGFGHFEGFWAFNGEISSLN